MTLPNINERATAPHEPVEFHGSDQDLPSRVPGQNLDQGSPSGRHLAQDPLNAADDDDDYNPDDYEYVRIGGKLRAVRKADIQDEPETATQAVPKTAMVEVVDPHFYVWLANGTVIRVKQSDLPAPAGTNAPFGHWQQEDSVFQIVNVVPVEDKVKGEPNA